MSLAVEDFAMNFAVNEKLRKNVEKNNAEINILTNNVDDGPGFFHKSHTQFVVFLIMVIFNGGEHVSIEKKKRCERRKGVYTRADRRV